MTARGGGRGDRGEPLPSYGHGGGTGRPGGGGSRPSGFVWTAPAKTPRLVPVQYQAAPMGYRAPMALRPEDAYAAQAVVYRAPAPASPQVVYASAPAPVTVSTWASPPSPSPSPAPHPLAPAASSTVPSVVAEAEMKLLVSEAALAPPAAALAAAVAVSQGTAAAAATEAAPDMDLAPIWENGFANPPRLGAGTIGKKDATNLESKLRSTNSEVLNEVIKLHKKTYLGAKLLAYDGVKSLYTAASFHFESKEFVVKLVDSEKKDKESYVTVPRSFFSTTLGHRGDTCYYQSLGPTQLMLSLNIDISASSFSKPVTVIKFVEELRNIYHVSRPLSHRDRMKIKKASGGVCIDLQDQIRRGRMTWITPILMSQLMEKTCASNVGQWNMINKKMTNGGTVDNWTCLNFSRMCPEEVLTFCIDLVHQCNATGMAFNPNPIVDVRSAAPNHIENALRDVHRRATQLTKQGMGNQLQLLVVILPEVSGSYGKIRRFCETDIGIVSQCCLPKYARKPNRQYLENVAFKINIKVGGCNTVLEQAFVRNSIPFVPEVPTAIFGADVTHTPPVSVPPCVLPPPQVPAQPHGEQITEESITLSEDSLMGHIVNDMIRDAASEGLSSHVLLHEIDAIRMGGPLSETITIEVVMLNVLVPIQIEKPATLDKVVHEAMRVLNVHLTDVYYTCEGKPVPKGCLLGQPCKLLTCHRLRGGVRNAAVKLRKLIARQMRDNLGKWFERIDIPNDLRTKPNITYTVGLGENAQWVLSMLSDSLENTHADGLSFDGSFDLDDIWYIPDTRSIEIRGRSTTRLTQQGYVLDEGVVMTVMDTFFVYQESDGSVQYPMYIQDLVMRIENLDNAGDEYESTIKRSMIFLHAATRSGCDRVKTFDTLMVHYHKLRPADASAFRVALGEGLNPLRWTAAIRASPQMNKVLTHTIWDNVNRVYRMKFYPENHF